MTCDHATKNGCASRSQFLVYYDLGPRGPKHHPCSKHLASAVRLVAAAGIRAVQSKVIVFVKPLGGAR